MASVVVETKTTDQDGNSLDSKNEFDFGGNLQEMIQLFGEDVVANQAQAAIKIGLQNYIRGLLRQGKSKKEVDKAVAEWKPGVRPAAKSKVEKIKDAAGKLSDEERKALIAELKGEKQAA